MVMTFLKLSVRSLWRQKGYTLVNIAGLAFGMALFLLIAVFVLKELQTDKFHRRYKQIYRLEIDEYAVTASMASGFVSTILPEALEVCRLDVGHSNVLVNSGEQQFRINELIYADSSFFHVFSFDLIHGDPATVLSEPLSIVISVSEGEKLFGNVYPVGQTLKVNNNLTFQVTGVMNDVPGSSSLKPTAVIPFHALEQIRGDNNILNDWNNWNYYTYLLLPVNHDIKTINQKVQEGMDQIASERLGFPDLELGFFLRPLSDIYFNQSILYDHVDKGNKTFIMVYIAIAVFILIIAVVNFINLSTAMAFRRAREVGLKKVMGCTKANLVRQYLGEAIMVSLVALLIAILLFVIMVPEFNQLTHSNIDLSLVKKPVTMLFFILFALMVGVLSGLYPAFFLTRFEPAVVMKGTITRGKRGGLLRKVLIVFQFTISISIIMATIVIYSQMKYAQKKDLGFDSSNIIHFYSSGSIREKYETFSNELKQIPGVESVGFSSSVPGFVQMGWGRMVDTVERRIKALAVNPEFLDVYGLKIVSGRAFDPHRQSDRDSAFILNETAVKQFNLQEPLGVSFSHGSVVGVVEDFSFVSLHHSIEPLVLAYLPSWCSQISIKLCGSDFPETIDRIEEVWHRFAPGFPFSWHFLDDSIGRLYEKEQRLFRLFIFFSLLAIFVACLGLSGLALFTTQQRTKEVGIRKILGSSEKEVVLLLTRDFLVLVLMANIIAWPVAWYAMTRWLENFAFHTEIEWWMFALSGLLALIMAVLTISFQAARTAMANPVEALKYE